MVPIYTPCRREVLWEALLPILPDSPPPPSSLSNFPESFPDSFPTPIYSSGWRGAVWSGAIRKSHLQLLANGYTVPSKSWLNLLSETVKKHLLSLTAKQNHAHTITFMIYQIRTAHVVLLIPYLNNTENPSYKTKYSIEGHQY